MKVQLDETNYEAFLTDYLDGNLDENEVQELQRFLDNHPDLNSGIMESGEVLCLDPPGIVFDGKAAFKRIAPGAPVDQYNRDAYCIAYMEGDLDDFSRRQFEKEVESNASLRYFFHRYHHAVIKPDHEVVFPRKAQIKRGKSFSMRKSVFMPMMAAAVIFIAVGIHWFREAVTVSEELAYTPEMEMSLQPMKLDYARTPMLRPAPPENAQEQDKIAQKQQKKPAKQDVDQDRRHKAPALQPRFHVRDVGRMEPNLNPAPINYREIVYAADLKNGRKALPGRVIELFKTEVLKMEKPNAMITGWDVAYLGIHTFNRIAGTRLEVTRNYDGDSNTKSLAIEPQLFRQAEMQKSGQERDN